MGSRQLSLWLASSSPTLQATCFLLMATKPWSPLTPVVLRTSPHGVIVGEYSSSFSNTLVMPWLVAGSSSVTSNTIGVDLDAILSA